MIFDKEGSSRSIQVDGGDRCDTTDCLYLRYPPSRCQQSHAPGWRVGLLWSILLVVPLEPCIV